MKICLGDLMPLICPKCGGRLKYGRYYDQFYIYCERCRYSKLSRLWCDLEAVYAVDFLDIGVRIVIDYGISVGYRELTKWYFVPIK